MFHVEVRQFPHVARAFNLTAGELQARVLEPWLRDGAVIFDERRFTRERGKLKVLEAAELAAEQLGLGRGWPQVERDGNDVTEALLKQAQQRVSRDPAIEQLKGQLLENCERAPLSLGDAVRLASAMDRDGPPSTALARAEQAVWELLHMGSIELADIQDRAVERRNWQQLLLEWDVWTAPQATTLSIRRSRSSSEANR